jgi:hypothetical protein
MYLVANIEIGKFCTNLKVCTWIIVFCAFQDQNPSWQHRRWTWKCEDNFFQALYNNAHHAHHCFLSNTSQKPQKLKHKLEMKLSEIISCNMVIEILPNISNRHHLSIYGNAYVVKAQTKFKLSCPISVSRWTHTKRIALEDWGVKALEFARSMKICLKDQTKKTKEENAKTWPSKKPNIKVNLMGGWLAVDMHGAWHPIPFYEDGMAW